MKKLILLLAIVVSNSAGASGKEGSGVSLFIPCEGLGAISVNLYSDKTATCTNENYFCQVGDSLVDWGSIYSPQNVGNPGGPSQAIDAWTKAANNPPSTNLADAENYCRSSEKFFFFFDGGQIETLWSEAGKSYEICKFSDGTMMDIWSLYNGPNQPDLSIADRVNAADYLNRDVPSLQQLAKDLELPVTIQFPTDAGDDPWHKSCSGNSDCKPDICDQYQLEQFHKEFSALSDEAKQNLRSSLQQKYTSIVLSKTNPSLVISGVRTWIQNYDYANTQSCGNLVEQSMQKLISDGRVSTGSLLPTQLSSKAGILTITPQVRWDRSENQVWTMFAAPTDFYASINSVDQFKAVAQTAAGKMYNMQSEASSFDDDSPLNSAYPVCGALVHLSDL